MTITSLQKGSSKRIESFIQSVNHEFVPTLSSKVDIGNWAVKLDDLAYNFACLDHSNEIEALISFYINEDSYITFFSVQKEKREKGLGVQLLDRCIEVCREKHSNSIRVETWLSNHVAINLYLSRGFDKIEVRHDRPNESTLVLEKKLMYNL